MAVMICRKPSLPPSAGTSWRAASTRPRRVTAGKGSRRLFSQALSIGLAKTAPRVLDACPVDAGTTVPPISLYHGIASTFRRAGFREVTQRRPDRPLDVALGSATNVIGPDPH